ncbi:uncharacterized protein PHACADRAFT_266384, partial [Phanerochaete carnosa HHB-10118-sp]
PCRFQPMSMPASILSVSNASLCRNRANPPLPPSSPLEYDRLTNRVSAAADDQLEMNPLGSIHDLSYLAIRSTRYLTTKLG